MNIKTKGLFWWKKYKVLKSILTIKIAFLLPHLRLALRVGKILCHTLYDPPRRRRGSPCIVGTIVKRPWGSQRDTKNSLVSFYFLKCKIEI